MTAQEAINAIQIKEMQIECKATRMLEFCEGLVMAEEALEKQIPTKPDFEGDGYADGQLVYDTWICPHCGEYYEVDYDDYDYCPNCGQAIDWSDEQNERT